MASFKYRIITFCISLMLLGAVIMVLATNGSVAGTPGTAFAQFLVPTSTASASVFVTPGALTFSNGAPSSPAGVTLSNADQTATYTIAITTNDNTGTGNGWNLTLSMTQFTNGSGKTLANNVTTISNPAISACQGGGTCTLPTDSITAGSYPLATTADGATTTKFFGASANTGMGGVIITPTFTTTIQAKAYTGTYTSTFTISLNTGP